jgi:hypothetical protein
VGADKKSEGEIDFIKHILTGEKESDSPYGVKFTQAHALVSVDMDGDGLLDFVTGKRWWAHEPRLIPRVTTRLFYTGGNWLEAQMEPQNSFHF